MRGVEAADVKRRIRFGVAEPLSLREADLERQVLALHAGEDVVASAVENAGNPLNCVSGQTLAQGLDDGNPAADRRLEMQLRPRSLGKGRELEPMRREHRLIGRNDRYPAGKRSFGRLKRDSIGAADQFDEYVDFGGGGKFRCAREVDGVAKIDAALVLAARAIGEDREFASRPCDEPFPLPL